MGWFAVSNLTRVWNIYCLQLWMLQIVIFVTVTVFLLLFWFREKAYYPSAYSVYVKFVDITSNFHTFIMFVIDGV
jgi:hypothetical protein